METGGLSPHHIGYIAIHGTGTPLGDPIEVGALSTALRQPPKTDASLTLAFGAVKVELPPNFHSVVTFSDDRLSTCSLTRH